MKYQELLEKANRAKQFAYAPYSNFRVGAAILAKSGKVYTGVNVENAAYTVTCCAERVALYNAVSSGERDFEAIAVTSDSSRITTPCGICRQALSEFSPHMDVVSSNGQLAYEIDPLDTLLPKAFSGEEMERK